MSKIVEIFQQGDVLFKRIKSFDESKLTKLDTRTIQEGEVTGHSHVLQASITAAEVYAEPTDLRNKFVRILADSVFLLHEEHKPVELPAGDYVIGIVREMDHLNEMVRRVVD